MGLKKHYPDKHLMKAKSTQVGRAIMALLKMDVEIMRINFRAADPVIEVYNCPGTRNIKAVEHGGQGENDAGRYVIKKAFIRGCCVMWSE